MKNAFLILGAEPTDTAERLSEILDEKQLLLDDASVAQEAYTELTNPKKRIKHEVSYLFGDSFWYVSKIATDIAPSTSVSVLAKAISDLGRYFDVDFFNVTTSINEFRAKSGYPQLQDSAIIENAVYELKNDYKNELTSYLDELTDNKIISLFNNIVKIRNYQSFFIDELMAYYENRLSEAIRKKQDKCVHAFNVMEKSCRQVIDGDSFPQSAQDEYNIFEEALLKLDKILQPLQVNAQKHGASHNISENLVHDLRNKVIDLCNESQDSVIKLLNKLEEYDRELNKHRDFYFNENVRFYPSSFGVEDELLKILPENIKLMTFLQSVLQLFYKVFAEIDLMAERLKKDTEDFTNIINSLRDIQKKIDPSGYKSKTNTISTEKTEILDDNQNATEITPTPKPQQESWHRKYKIWYGILAIILLIFSITGYVRNVVAAGVVGIFTLIGTCIVFLINESNCDFDEIIYKIIGWIINIITFIVAFILICA